MLGLKVRYRLNNNQLIFIPELNYIKGEIDWEWLFSRDNDFATAIDIFLVVKEYGKRCK